MSFNLVSALSQVFNSETIARLAQAIGVDPSLAQKLINAAIPSLLGSMGSIAATPAGAQRLSEQVAQQDSNVLGGLLSGIGGPDHNSMIDYGSGILSTLLGGNAASSTLSTALSRFTGAPAAASNSVLGLLAPATLGVIGQQDPSSWSSPNGIASLFESQKSAIQSALPAGIAASLGGLLGNFSPSATLSGVAGSANAALGNAANTVTDTARNIGNRVENAAASAANSVRNAEQRAENAVASSGLPSWLLPVIGLAVLALLAWYFLVYRAHDAKAPQPGAAITTNVNEKVDAFKNNANATFAKLATTLTGITNTETANAALPKLKDFDAELGKLQTQMQALPDNARSVASSGIAGLITASKAAIDRALAVPGVGEVIRPVTTPIMQKLDALSKA